MTMTLLPHLTGSKCPAKQKLEQTSSNKHQQKCLRILTLLQNSGCPERGENPLVDIVVLFCGSATSSIIIIIIIIIIIKIKLDKKEIQVDMIMSPRKKRRKHIFLGKTSLLPKSFITSKRPKTAAISDWLGATTSGCAGKKEPSNSPETHSKRSKAS